jgi:hypothetical protein
VVLLVTENPNLGDQLRALVEQLEQLKTDVTERLKTCPGCGRPVPTRVDEQEGWQAFHVGGYVHTILCPDCQTPEQAAEREIRGATESYRLENGRVVRQPKTFDDDDKDGGQPSGQVWCTE